MSIRSEILGLLVFLPILTTGCTASKRNAVLTTQVERGAPVKDPDDDNASYRFAPHFGETLAEFNDSVKPKFSDHRPIVVDIPLQEPPGL